MDAIGRSLSMGMPPRGRSLTRQSFPTNARNRDHAPSPPKIRPTIPVARRIHSEADMQQSGLVVEEHDATTIETVDHFYAKPLVEDAPLLSKLEQYVASKALRECSKVQDFGDTHCKTRHVSEITNEDLNEVLAWRPSSKTSSPCWGSRSNSVSWPMASLSQRQSNVPV